jgi:hypothetical protein
MMNESEVRFPNRIRVDDVGEVFEWNGNIYRGIFSGKADDVLDMFESGLIEELVEEELFPKSKITDLNIGDYEMIVQHDRVDPITYPHEWTFSMLKDAALAVVRVAKIARKYGFNMKDCHSYNILFDKNKPKYIDLGSFYRDNDYTVWKAYMEFLASYYYPLTIWKDGIASLARSGIVCGMGSFPTTEYYLYRYSFLRLLKTGTVSRLVKIVNLLPTVSIMDESALNTRLDRYTSPMKALGHILKFITNHIDFPFKNLDKIEKRVLGIRKREVHTEWNSYYGKNFVPTNRFRKTVELINEYCPDAKTAIDIGGNVGEFASFVLDNTSIDRVICQDLDLEAIDFGYSKYGNTEKNIVFVNYNFMSAFTISSLEPPHKRFESDIAIALALTHHLILSQGCKIGDILKEIGSYSKKYVGVEFMPLGLWGPGAEVKVPCWYTTDWFRDNFGKYFELLVEEQLEENRIVFVGKKLKYDEEFGMGSEDEFGRIGQDGSCLADRSTHPLLELPCEDLPDRWVRRGCLAQVNASSLDRARGDDVAQDLMDRGLLACTATDAHDAKHRVPCSIQKEWGKSLWMEGLQ